MIPVRLYLMAGVAAVFVALVAAVGVQSARLSHAKTDLLAARSELKGAQNVVEAYKATIAARDAKARADAALAVSEAGELAALYKSTCKGAFNAGYASRRCPDGSVPDGLPDLRATQSAGRFAGSDDLSTQSGGTRPR
jgi:hypothetical protein